ncbi:modification methylase, partial [archaeon]|nr:modification methylase [archaeon]
MSNNTNLNKAKAAKNNEFYTRLEDIENELQYYEKQFK